jgi:hypothetical protein
MRKFPASEGVDWVEFGTKVSSYFHDPPAAGSLFHL